MQQWWVLDHLNLTSIGGIYSLFLRDSINPVIKTTATSIEKRINKNLQKKIATTIAITASQKYPTTSLWFMIYAGVLVFWLLVILITSGWTDQSQCSWLLERWRLRAMQRRWIPCSLLISFKADTSPYVFRSDQQLHRLWIRFRITCPTYNAWTLRLPTLCISCCWI